MTLNEIVLRYVTFRKSMGDDFSSAESVLKIFCRRMGEDVALVDITADHVQAFLAGTGTVSGYWRRKYDALRGLYKYAISRGFIEKAPLPSTAVRAPRFKPHIYTDDEVRRLLNAVPICLNPPRKLEPYTMRSILLLLYGAGLRIGEVVALTVADVDMSASVITIRNAKFHKTRIVPVGSQLGQIIADYAARREAAGHSTDAKAPFFVLRRGASTSVQIVQCAFRRLCKQASVCRQDGARYQPRLHDMRHSFAVRRLTSWYRDGADVQRLLPQLATYMGHVKLSATQVYLTMTPELLREASERFERYACQEERHG
jgi:integrase/recombinase XerD